MEHELCIATVKNLINYEFKGTVLHEFNKELHEKQIQDMLKNYPISDPTQLEELIDSASKSEYIDLYVYLLELKQDYSKCFDQYFDEHKPEYEIKIFDWLEHIQNAASPNSVKALQGLIYKYAERLVISL